MSITVLQEVGTSHAAAIFVYPESWKHFSELIQRGANLWPDAPPEIKEFADLVTNGEVMQDYRAQAGNFKQLVPVPPFPSTSPTQGE